MSSGDDAPSAPASLSDRFDAALGLDAVDRRRLWAPRFAPCGRASRDAWLAWRAFAFVYSAAVSSFDAATTRDRGRYLAYLTVQSLWLVVFYFALALAAALVARLTPAAGAGARLEPLACGGGAARCAWGALQRAAALAFAVAVPFQLVVVTLYWALLATPFSDPVRAWDNAESHGVKFALIWADLLAGAGRLPDGALPLVVALGCVYLATNAAVTLATGVPVYAILNWRGAGTAVVAGGSALFLVVAFVLAAELAAARDGAAARARAAAPAGAAAAEDGAHPAAFDDDPAPAPCGGCRRAQAAAGEASAAAPLL